MQLRPFAVQPRTFAVGAGKFVRFPSLPTHLLALASIPFPPFLLLVQHNQNNKVAAGMAGECGGGGGGGGGGVPREAESASSARP